MSQTAAGAVEWMRRQNQAGSTGWAGFCLRASRMSWSLPGGWPDARAWWNACPREHRRPWSNRPPLGAPVYWDGGRHGHIAISDGNGNVWGTDLPTWDRIGLVPIGEIRRRWGMPETGWAVWLNGRTLPINEAGTPGGNEEPMSSPDEIARAVWELQLPDHTGREQFRARTFLVRGAARAVWDEAIPDTYGNGVDQTARRTLRDVARASMGRAASAYTLDDGTERRITDADAEAIAARLAGFMRRQDDDAPPPAS